MKEKERKFKLKYIPDTSEMTGYNIEQGYLMFDGSKHLRVRISRIFMNKAEFLAPIAEAFICFKNVNNIEEKDEFEYKIPLIDGMELMNSTNIKLRKKRYKTTFQGNSVDIDFFEDGTSWVEIEFETPFKELPDYCGEEITGHKELNNIFIAIQNSKK